MKAIKVIFSLLIWIPTVIMIGVLLIWGFLIAVPWQIARDISNDIIVQFNEFLKRGIK